MKGKRYSEEPRTELTREALYAEVWAEPMTKVARWYGLSDRRLAKVDLRPGVIPSFARHRTAGRPAQLGSHTPFQPAPEYHLGHAVKLAAARLELREQGRSALHAVGYGLQITGVFLHDAADRVGRDFEMKLQGKAIVDCERLLFDAR